MFRLYGASGSDCLKLKLVRGIYELPGDCSCLLVTLGAEVLFELFFGFIRFRDSEYLFSFSFHFGLFSLKRVLLVFYLLFV